MLELVICAMYSDGVMEAICGANQCSSKLAIMDVHLTPEKEAQLHQLATRTRRDAAQVIEEALDRLLADDAQFHAAVREGFAAIGRGDFIEEEEMDARVARMLGH